MNKIILDCDTGEDDALAIIVAVKNNLPLDYIVTSHGNTSLENATQNTSRILSLVEAEHIMVIPGSDTPLKEHPIEKEVFSAGDFVGKNGLCNVELPESKYENILQFENEEYIDKLIEVITSGPKYTYIITGPCTNFAKLCMKLGDKIHNYIEHVYIMGGAIYEAGNSGPIDPSTGRKTAEFNFYADPYAVEIVLKSKLPLYLVTWDITSKVTIPHADIEKFTSSTAVGEFSIELMTNFFNYYGLSHDREFELNDPLTILAYMGWGTYKKEKVRILTDTQKAGSLVLDEQGYDINYFQLEDKGSATKKILQDLHVVIS